MDVFADFVMLVVPKVGQECARWKYDARKNEKTLTVYRLSYHDQTAVVSDCLSLQFCTEPSNLFTYSLIPTFTSQGNKRETSFIQDLLGKSVLTSAAEIQKLLHCLDREDQESDSDLALHIDEAETEQASHYPPFFEREGTLGSDACSWGDDEKGHSDATSDSDFLVKTESRIKKKLKDRRTSLRRSARNVPVEPEMPVKRASRRKRSTEEPEIGVKKMKKNGLRKRSQSCKKGKHSEVQEALVDSIVFEDIPSLPQHPTSGGTILSSQYWTLPAEGRTRLDCTKHIFIDNDALSSLPHLSAVSPEELFTESVKYGWSLVEHLLGGSEGISRSFAYVSSGTCPIEKEELMGIVVQLSDAVREHLQRSFHIDRVGDVGKAIMVVMKPKLELRYKELGSTNACPSHTRQPSDMLLKGHLKKSSYPAPRKVQLAHGFDFYGDGDKLLEIEGRCREDPLQGRRCGIFAMDVVAELIGGLDVFLEGRKQTYRGGTVLLGDDIFEALFLRARKTLNLDDTIALKEFRAFV
ncbi:hypothetical protein RvY_13254 [Ramazzottius varieornatus]|uniref:Uncharacterized protein n=1 Tax=Ramazzottius varieornatus TaxID=947166 RepID=A0A1D1VM97_RAMVA|nr:hypothetical protein RvY_13254 [Ramazzottius varieornatus]